MLEAALAACPAVAKTDVRGSPVPFARELASYLAHCDKVGGLTLAVQLESSPFLFFFRTLNQHLVLRAAEAATEEAARRERAAMDEAGSGGEESGGEGSGSEEDDGHGEDSDEDQRSFDFGANIVLQQERDAKRREEKDEHNAWLRDKTDEILDKMWLEQREKERREKRRLVRRSPKPGRAPRWAPEEAPITE